MGTYDYWSPKHMHRYCSEFADVAGACAQCGSQQTYRSRYCELLPDRLPVLSPMPETLEFAAAARQRREEEERQRREAERQRILDDLEIARDPAGVFDERSQDLPIIPKKGAEVIGMISGTGLVEVKAGRVQYRGGSAGTSVRVMKGVSVRVGQHKGTAYREPEMPRLLCSGGTLVITNQRAVYAGPKHTRDFHWAKLMAMTASSGEGGPCLLFICYGEADQGAGDPSMALSVSGERSHVIAAPAPQPALSTTIIGTVGNPERSGHANRAKSAAMMAPRLSMSVVPIPLFDVHHPLCVTPCRVRAASKTDSIRVPIATPTTAMTATAIPTKPASFGEEPTRSIRKLKSAIPTIHVTQ